MIIDKQETITVITQEKLALTNFVNQLEEKYDQLKGNHLIINLFSLTDFSKDDIHEFLRISKRHKSAKKSFVVVSNRVAYDEISEEITLVPTLQEAYDIIEMEDIERDLDF